MSKSDPWNQLGGGAVNERERHSLKVSASNYDPVNHRSHLYHSLEGFHRYPNYLVRWNHSDDVDRLEDALQAQLDEVRAQRESIRKRKNGIRMLVRDLIENEPEWADLLESPDSWETIQSTILDPEANKAIFGKKPSSKLSRILPTVEQVLQGRAEIPLDIGRLETLMDEELFDVYGFPLLRTEFCTQLRRFIGRVVELGSSESTYHELQLGRRPVDLDMVGLSWLNDLIFYLIMKPIAAQLFDTTETQGPLDWRQAYVAGYAADPREGTPRERLETHTDDSEVTMNICLSDNFTGGNLEFRGLRGTQDEGQLIDTYEPVMGRSIIHAGRHFHDVTPVESGERFVLIMWARSWTGVRSRTCACCWLNRRDGRECICGCSWN